MGADETVLPALSLALSLMNLLEEPTRRGCNWWAPVAASEVATTHCGQSGNLQRRGGLPAGRGGKLPLAAGGISLAVTGRQRDPLVSWVGRRRRVKEEGLEMEQDPCSGAAVENLEISFA